MKCTCGADNWIHRYETEHNDDEKNERIWVESECQNCGRCVN